MKFTSFALAALASIASTSATLVRLHFDPKDGLKHVVIQNAEEKVSQDLFHKGKPTVFVLEDGIISLTGRRIGEMSRLLSFGRDVPKMKVDVVDDIVISSNFFLCPNRLVIVTPRSETTDETTYETTYEYEDPKTKEKQSCEHVNLHVKPISSQDDALESALKFDLGTDFLK